LLAFVFPALGEVDGEADGLTGLGEAKLSWVIVNIFKKKRNPSVAIKANVFFIACSFLELLVHHLNRLSLTVGGYLYHSVLVNGEAYGQDVTGRSGGINAYS